MGRSLTCGILTRFSIGRYNDDIKLKDEIEKIKKDMSTIIDLSLYNLEEQDEDKYVYSIKPEIVDNGIHELIKEMEKTTFPNMCGLYKSESEIKNMDVKTFKEKYSFKLKVKHTNSYDDGNYYIEFQEEELEERQWRPFNWMLRKYDKRRDVGILGDVISLWYNVDKVYGENDYYIIKIINNLKTKYYKSKLSGALVYGVE